MRGQTKYYCWTLANPGSLCEEYGNPGEWEWEHSPATWSDVAYVVYQLERCPKTGTLHLQGYLELKNRARFLSVKKKVPALAEAHFEARKGNADEARDYCMKLDTRVAGPWEHGLWTPEQQRKDQKTKATELLVKRVREGASDSQLWEEFPGLMLIYNGSVKKARIAFGPAAQRSQMPNVFLFVGVAGTGKSRTAQIIARNLGTVYTVPTAKSSGLYFDNYCCQTSIIIDDFDGARCTPAFFKQLCDRYAFSVPVHGTGNVNFNSPNIFITTNRIPKQWWKNQTQTEVKAIMRRFCCIIFFGRREAKPKNTIVYHNGAFASVSPNLALY